MARDPIPPPEQMTKEHSPMKVRLQPGEDIREYCGYVIDLSYTYSLTLDPNQAPAYRHPLALSYFIMNGLPDCHIFKKLKETYKDLLERNDDGYRVPNHTRYYNVQHHYYKMTAYLMCQKILECIPEGGLKWNSQGKVVTPGPRPKTRARKRSELEDSDEESGVVGPSKWRQMMEESDSEGSKEKEAKHRRKYVPAPGDEEEFEEEKDEEAKEPQQTDGVLTNTDATNQEENQVEQVQERDSGANVATLGRLTPHIILLAMNLCLTLGSFYFRFR